MKMLESLHLNGNKIHLSLLECAGKRSIASLLSHVFCDLPFTMSLLTVSLVYLLWGTVGGSQNKCIRRIFSSLSLPLTFPPKKNA